eukprot:111263-Rhodomonas_salina.2
MKEALWLLVRAPLRIVGEGVWLFTLPSPQRSLIPPPLKSLPILAKSTRPPAAPSSRSSHTSRPLNLPSTPSSSSSSSSSNRSNGAQGAEVTGASM